MQHKTPHVMTIESLLGEMVVMPDRIVTTAYESALKDNIMGY
jgi:hypothetical protein